MVKKLFLPDLVLFYYMKLKTNYYQSRDFDAADYIYNCKLHKKEILIAFVFIANN